MNDKDKEAFEKWWDEIRLRGQSTFGIVAITWQAACEYKQKEIDEIELREAKSNRGFVELASKFCKLQAENAKLRECVKFYAKEGNWDDRILLILDDTEDTAYSSYNGGKRARQVLKELEEK